MSCKGSELPVNSEEPLRVLGLAADATQEGIRQAYLDLVRVWHPDRFQSDARLRQIAEERLREINEAYVTLKNYRSSVHSPLHSPRSSRAPAGADRAGADRAGANRAAADWAGANSDTCSGAATATQDPPRPEATTWNAATAGTAASATVPASSPAFGLHAWLPAPIRHHTAYAAVVAAPCLAALLAAIRVVTVLSAPMLDTRLIAARAAKPAILTPMRIIDPSGGVPAAADTLTEWARGDGMDLWKTATVRPLFGNASPAVPDGRTQATGTAASRHTRRSIPVFPKEPASGSETAQHIAPPNGTELFAAARRQGAGELRLVNRTNLAAIVRLVSGKRVPLRAVYVAANSSATMRSIGIGVYNLHVELGRDVDAERLRFQNDRSAPETFGPFEFLEITSENGVSGKRYEVALNPGSR